MATLPHSPSYQRNIVKKLQVDYSDELDFTFDEEESDPATIVRKTDASTQTLATEGRAYPKPALANNHQVYHSSTGIYPQSSLYNSLSPFTRSKYKRFDLNILSPSVENRDLPTSESCPVRLGARRSQSVSHLSCDPLNVKLTDDSGTGDSLDPLPLRTNSKHYESVPIYEQDISALISNRYDFIQSKVDEYRRQKRATRPSIPTMILPDIPAWKPDPKHKKRRESRLPSASGHTKSPTLLSRVMKIFKSP